MDNPGAPTLESPGEYAARNALAWSMVEQRRTGELPKNPSGPQGAVPPERTEHAPSSGA